MTGPKCLLCGCMLYGSEIEHKVCDGCAQLAGVTKIDDSVRLPGAVKIEEEERPMSYKFTVADRITFSLPAIDVAALLEVIERGMTLDPKTATRVSETLRNEISIALASRKGR